MSKVSHWKFPIKIQDKQTVEMPFGTEFLSAQFQGDQLCVWALVNPLFHPEQRTFRIFRTGQMIDDPVRDCKFIGTAQSPSGLVWHVWVEQVRNIWES